MKYCTYIIRWLLTITGLNVFSEVLWGCVEWRESWIFRNQSGIEYNTMNKLHLKKMFLVNVTLFLIPSLHSNTNTICKWQKHIHLLYIILETVLVKRNPDKPDRPGGAAELTGETHTQHHPPDICSGKDWLFKRPFFCSHTTNTWSINRSIFAWSWHPSQRLVPSQKHQTLLPPTTLGRQLVCWRKVRMREWQFDS